MSQHATRRTAAEPRPFEGRATAVNIDAVTAAGTTPNLSIGELASRTGVTAETIRYYEREGVVPPAARAGAGKYRAYSDADVERLRFIRRARDLGFSLDEVRGLMTLATGDPTRSCGEVNEIAAAHLAAVEAKLADLAKLRAELEQVIGRCTGIVPVAECRILGALGGELSAPSTDIGNPSTSGRRRAHATVAAP